MAPLNLESVVFCRLKIDSTVQAYYTYLNGPMPLPTNEYVIVQYVVSEIRTGGNRLQVPPCKTSRLTNNFQTAVKCVTLFIRNNVLMLRPYILFGLECLLNSTNFSSHLCDNYS